MLEDSYSLEEDFELESLFSLDEDLDLDLELPLSDGEDLLSFDFELEEEEEDLDPDVGVEGRLLGLSLLPLSLDLKHSNACFEMHRNLCYSYIGHLAVEY